MLARRLLIVLVVLMALTAVAASVSPRVEPGSGGDASVPAAPAPALAQGRVQRTLDAGATGQRVVARVGQSVVITVTSRTLETVSLAELGTRTAEPDSPARFELLADAPGTYPIELLESQRRIGMLQIRRAG